MKKSIEKVSVEVEIFWGKEFNGSYNAETPGKGCYVTVMQARCPENDYGRSEFSFRGCPLGSATTVERAIEDFVARGKHEYQGEEPLTRAMVHVARTKDHRVK